MGPLADAPASSSGSSTAPAARPSGGRARSATGRSTRARARARCERRPNLTILEGMAEELDRGAAAASPGRSPRAESAIARARGRRDDRDVPERPDAHGRAPDRGRPRRRGAPRGALGGARAPRASRSAGSRRARRRALHRDTIDYAACAPQQGDDPPRAVLVPDRADALPARAGALLADRDERARPRADPREPAPQPDVLGPDPGHRPALLPVGRGQGRASSPTRRAHVFLEPDGWDPRRSTSTASRPRCPKRCSARSSRAIPGLARARMIRPGLRRRVRLRLSRPARLDARGAGGSGALPRGPDQRHLGLRGGRRAGPAAPGSTRRSPCAGEEPFVLERSRGVRGGDGRRPDQEGLDEPYRLFTSRAEYRLLLGVDTVLPRLAPHGRRLGLLDEEEYAAAMRGRGADREAPRRLRRQRS